MFSILQLILVAVCSRFSWTAILSAPDVHDFEDSTLIATHVTSLKYLLHYEDQRTYFPNFKLFRHGNRTPDPIELYPNDPYLHYDYYPFGIGQLTKAGKGKEYDIGKALRKRYDNFLGKYYTPHALEARSTDTNRTKMSLLLVLASLYPPNDEQVWQNNLDWQPVPYNYVPKKDDDLLFGINCPNYLEEYKRVQNEPEVKEQLNQYRGDVDYIIHHSGLNATNLEDVYNLYFALATEEEYGLKLPEWTKKVWPEKIAEIAFKQYDIYTKTPKLKKMAAGYLIKKIVEDSERKINNQTNLKIYLYSAHENNIGQLFATLDLFEEPHIPTYGSYVLFELHNIEGIYGIKIYYQNYDTERPKLLKLKGCEEFCPLDTFKSLVEEHFPEDGMCGN